MILKAIEERLSVCKVEDYSKVNLDGKYTFTGRTDEECSLVCPISEVPDNTTQRDDGWKAFRIDEGELDFSLIGILSRIAAILAQAKIGIFAISTFNTDYVLVKEDSFERALQVLEREGYEIRK